MKRCKTLGGYVVGKRRVGRLLLQLGIVEFATLLTACAPAARYEEPSTVRGYEILVTRRDSLGQGIAQGLKRRGFTVRERVRGGSRPTAYLFAFTFRETDPPALTWLHVRLADTRTGVIVAAVSAPLDSLGASAADQASAIVDSLAVSATLRRPISPP